MPVWSWYFQAQPWPTRAARSVTSVSLPSEATSTQMPSCRSPCWEAAASGRRSRSAPPGPASVRASIAPTRHGDQRHGRGPWSLPGPDTGLACAVKDGQGTVGVLLRPHQGDGPLVRLGPGCPYTSKIRSAPARAERRVVICWEIWFRGWPTCLAVVEVDHQAAQVKAHG